MTYQTNVFNHITEVSTHILGGVQIQSLSVQSDSEKLWSDANELLTQRQISDPIATENPDGSWSLSSSEYEEWKAQGTNHDNPELNAIVEEQYLIVYGDTFDATTGTVTATNVQTGLNDIDDADSMEKFVTDVFSDPAYLSAVSSAFMVTTMDLLNQNWNDSTGSTTMTTLNNVASLVSSNAQYEEQLGESDINMLNSLIQQTASSGQTITTCNEQVMGALSNWITLMNKF